MRGFTVLLCLYLMGQVARAGLVLDQTPEAPKGVRLKILPKPSGQVKGESAHDTILSRQAWERYFSPEIPPPQWYLDYSRELLSKPSEDSGVNKRILEESIKNFKDTRLSMITRAFRAILGRDPEASETKAWLLKVVGQSMTEEQLRKQLQPKTQTVGGVESVSVIDGWDESATRSEKNSTLSLSWKNELGDWIDRNNVPQGDAAFASVFVKDEDKEKVVELDVKEAISAANNKADFLIQKSGGTNLLIWSREAGEKGPLLVLNGTRTLRATSDTYLSRTTYKSLGTQDTLETSSSRILIRFLLPDDVSKISSAKLVLTLRDKQYDDQTLKLFNTHLRGHEISFPNWLRGGTQTLLEVSANQMSGGSLLGDIRTANIRDGLLWMDGMFGFAPQKQACVTVFLKFHQNFRPGAGGKIPGLSNTGQHRPYSSTEAEMVNGKGYHNAGWGGRNADGVHWSARTNFGAWNEDHVAFRTYYYAVDPKVDHGQTENINAALPKGQWSGYVQCIEMNSFRNGSPNRDGKLFYQVIGGGASYEKSDIVWRSVDSSASEIREFWANFYCGGIHCGSNPSGEVSFYKAIVTNGYPNYDQMKHTLDSLNAR